MTECRWNTALWMLTDSDHGRTLTNNHCKDITWVAFLWRSARGGPAAHETALAANLRESTGTTDLIGGRRHLEY